ncbi:MAG: phosphoribosylglycinamide formyltransferase [Clostridia bacterium]|nr:phosphoribosylglycinamide formyltransferase [Clostridia bacterium]MBQ5661454.1 phosphoribosylglycinamide formyltransferase [Clostridia bacterium]
MSGQATRIAVLVSGGGTNLQALIDAQSRGELGNGRITLVIASKPGVYALERAANHGIEARVLARKDYDSIAAYSKALADAMEEAGIDLVVLAGFLTIIDEQVYERFPNRILNVHPALIPSFCGKGYYGLRVHEAALEKGVRVSGATVHIVTPECDAGPIVLQKAVEVRQDDTPEILQKRIMEEAEWRILPEAVRLFCDGKISVEGHKVLIKGEKS